MILTESLPMTPAGSVSGFYLAHLDAQHSNAARIGQDQIADPARRMAVALHAASVAVCAGSL